MFGGWNGSTRLSRIAAYDPSQDEWTSEGDLLTPRRNAGVISVAENSFIIIGGYQIGQRSSEKCIYNGDQLVCSYQDPTEPSGKLLNTF